MLKDSYRIPDPFIAFNELDAEWVGEKSWTYKTSLPKLQPAQHDATTVLAFDGLDTFATAKLNGQEILKTDNMFVPHRIDITRHLKREGENVLEIEFEPALFKGRWVVRIDFILISVTSEEINVRPVSFREILKEHPEHAWHCMNGEPGRLAVRKAQYHWGWDWGPVRCRVP